MVIEHGDDSVEQRRKAIKVDSRCIRSHHLLCKHDLAIFPRFLVLLIRIEGLAADDGVEERGREQILDAAFFTAAELGCFDQIEVVAQVIEQVCRIEADLRMALVFRVSEKALGPIVVIEKYNDRMRERACR